MAKTDKANTSRRPRRLHIGATIDPELVEWLDQVAGEAGISRSQAINSLIRRVKNAEERSNFQAFPEFVSA